MDLTTLRAILKTELHANSPYVDIAIADALLFVRNEELWFNGAIYTLTTQPDIYKYNLPDDFLGLRGQVYCSPGGSTETRYPLLPRTVDEIETHTYCLNEWDGSIATGRAKMYAIDLLDRNILFAPRPTETAGDTITFRYTRDLGTLKYTVSVTAPALVPVVTLLLPDGEPFIDHEKYINDWFNHGFVLIKSRALYELWTRFHGGSDEAGQKGQMALSRYLEELQRLRGESAQIQSTSKVRKWL